MTVIEFDLKKLKNHTIPDLSGFLLLPPRKTKLVHQSICVPKSLEQVVEHEKTGESGEIH